MSKARRILVKVREGRVAFEDDLCQKPITEVPVLVIFTSRIKRLLDYWKDIEEVKTKSSEPQSSEPQSAKVSPKSENPQPK